MSAFEKSKWYRARAERIIPGGSTTEGKAPNQYIADVGPSFLASGKGSRVWDVDGNEYIDYSMALAAVVLGHAYPTTVEAVSRQMREGSNFSLPNPAEVQLAEKLVELAPCVEMVRFGKNGSDVTQAAVRLARAFTGREKIAHYGYHGWHDWYLGSTSRDAGIPSGYKELILRFPYNDPTALARLFEEHPGEIAAVIMEPVRWEEPLDGWLESVRELTNRQGAVLIFDEVITGFRLALGGAQELYGVVPDLVCYSKAIGNGVPLAAFGGRRDIMELLRESLYSPTYAGEALSLAAGLDTIREMEEKDVIGHLWRQGAKLKSGFNRLAGEHGLLDVFECLGPAARTEIRFRASDQPEELKRKSLWQQECARRGIIFTGPHNVTFSHTDEDIERTLEAYDSAMPVLGQAIEEGTIEKRLEGLDTRPIFKSAG
jgi:glutamate-1-semialdehyde aminotransferase